jgi:uncharacterized membrane-anchored protein|tara:strand:- start:178 stop:366 length:189 start_codon:yes stop_codon:yes gene_type:complete
MNRAKKIAEAMMPRIEGYIDNLIEWQIESELTNKTIDHKEIPDLEKSIRNNLGGPLLRSMLK